MKGKLERQLPCLDLVKMAVLTGQAEIDRDSRAPPIMMTPLRERPAMRPTVEADRLVASSDPAMTRNTRTAAEAATRAGSEFVTKTIREMVIVATALTKTSTVRSLVALFMTERETVPRLDLAAALLMATPTAVRALAADLLGAAVIGAGETGVALAETKT